MAGCLIWIPLAIWAVVLVGWMVMGDIEPLFGIASLGTGLWLGLVAVKPPEPYMAPLALLAVVVTTVLYVPLSSQVRRRALARIDIEQMERVYDNLSGRSSGTLASMKLAELLYARGMVKEAVSVADNALPSLPKAVYRREHEMVELWRTQAGTGARSLACLSCGHQVAAGIAVCPFCGARHLLDYAKGRWLGPTVLMRALSAWAGIVALGLGIPATSASALPALGKVGVILLLLSASVVLVVKALARGTK